jgi:hypothetical protein
LSSIANALLRWLLIIDLCINRIVEWKTILFKMVKSFLKYREILWPMVLTVGYFEISGDFMAIGFNSWQMKCILLIKLFK